MHLVGVIVDTCNNRRVFKDTIQFKKMQQNVTAGNLLSQYRQIIEPVPATYWASTGNLLSQHRQLTEPVPATH